MTTFAEALAEALERISPIRGMRGESRRFAADIIAALADEWRPDRLRAENAALREALEEAADGTRGVSPDWVGRARALLGEKP